MAQLLSQKLKLKPGSRICLVNAPQGYLAILHPQDCELIDTLEGNFDWIQVFTKNKASLDAVFGIARKSLLPGGHLWITYPKGTSGLQSDLTRDKGWESVEGMIWVTLCSIDETWSAFCFRHPKAGEPLNDWRSKM
ncbi:MAG TPA: hypothetical protein VN226_04965 [Anaerolineales bacterium]|nr:hypothetical protein [Anaerolineales bacterium]